jgi:hypothetical protein
MRRALLLLVALSVVAVPAIAGEAAVEARSIDPYRGLGAWVDVFDYTARTQPPDAPLPITPDSVDDMAALGVRTLYLQVVNPVGERPDQLFDAPMLAEFVTRAHRRGVQVVAWYLPSLVDVGVDYATLKAIAAFRADGSGFDAIALDIEDTQGVPEVDLRTDRIVDLTKRTRKLLGKHRALGAIVYPAVQTEVINPALWPGFPYRRLASSVDVWLPMAYFTFRDVESGYRDAFRYTEESVRRLRAHVRDQSAPVHVIGGIADLMTPDDYVALRRAATRTRAVGLSIYDFRTTSSAAWPYLRGDVTVPTVE